MPVRHLAPRLLPQTCPGCGRLRSGPCDLCRSWLASAPIGEAPHGIAALWSYEGIARDLITGLKYRRQPTVAQWFADLASQRLPDHIDVDIITWAPTSTSRRHHRGFDQAELLARHLAHRWRVPARRLLTRGGGGHQTGRSRAQRLSGPVFRARRLSGSPTVLVVDDVVTTGATLWAAVVALRDAGAGEVRALAMAATPPPAALRTNDRPIPAGLGR
jgi:ComF family protein